MKGSLLRACIYGSIALATSSLAIRSILGYPYNPVLDSLTNFGLGFVGEKIFRTFYNFLYKSRLSKLLSLSTIATTFAIKEYIDSSAEIKQSLPNYLRKFFNKWNMADPYDVISGISGAALSLIIDNLIDRYYKNASSSVSSQFAQPSQKSHSSST
jgi:hypothetical protein